MQAIQERHENSLLKAEIEKLRDENKGLRVTTSKNPSCPNCGFARSSNNATTLPAEEHQLRIENAKLRAEVILTYRNFMSEFTIKFKVSNSSNLNCAT